MSVADEGNPDKVKHAALHYLSRQNRTQKELTAYLAKKGFANDAIDETIKSLQRLDLINDEFYVKHWIEYRLSHDPIGRIKAEFELRKKGIAEEIITKRIDMIYNKIAEDKLAYGILKKKKLLVKEMNTISEKRRIAALLERKGISTETVYKIIGEPF